MCCRAQIPPPSACSISSKSRRTAEGLWTDPLEAIGRERRIRLMGIFAKALARLAEPPPGAPWHLWTEVPEDEPRRQPEGTPGSALGGYHRRALGHLRHLRSLSAAHSQMRWRHLPAGSTGAERIRRHEMIPPPPCGSRTDGFRTGCRCTQDQNVPGRPPTGCRSSLTEELGSCLRVARKQESL
jgi:hypothetical protein